MPVEKNPHGVQRDLCLSDKNNSYKPQEPTRCVRRLCSWMVSGAEASMPLSHSLFVCNYCSKKITA